MSIADIGDKGGGFFRCGRPKFEIFSKIMLFYYGQVPAERG